MSSTLRNRAPARDPSPSSSAPKAGDDPYRFDDPAGSYGGGPKTKKGKPEWPIKFEPLKLMFALVLTMFLLKVTLPPPTAFPDADAAAAAGAEVKDSFVDDTKLQRILAAWTALLALFVAAYVVPLHLVPAYFPPLAPLSAFLTRLRGAVLGYTRGATPLYQPLHANEFIASVLVFAGAYLRIWAFETLADHFTYTVRIFDEHKLIGTGPYARLIHPSYTGLIVAGLAYAFFMGFRGLRFLAVCAAVFGAAHLRIVDEEVALREHFGGAWDAHVATRWRLVPYVW
ncbi:hypothetical protein H9P43_006317 [Blastocladiella emersonii ATCC 22665]|nr:hypothetical protein H9P43_006317 [Blastocladiella emersonii ATCC 22665]